MSVRYISKDQFHTERNPKILKRVGIILVRGIRKS